MAGEGLVGPNKVFIAGYNWLTLFFTRWPISYFMSKSTLFSDTEKKTLLEMLIIWDFEIIAYPYILILQYIFMPNNCNYLLVFHSCPYIYFPFFSFSVCLLYRLACFALNSGLKLFLFFSLRLPLLHRIFVNFFRSCCSCCCSLLLLQVAAILIML